MNSTLFPIRLHATISAAAVFGLAVITASAGAQSAVAPAPVPAIPDAATVPPAAIVDQPLAPAVTQELEEAQPSAQHVRLPGHWRWQDGHYAWIPTRWELPPVANATWVEPRWEKRGNGYVLVEGYWQQSAPAAAAVVQAPAAPAPQTVVVVNEPPPPPQREVIMERPSGSYIWINGYWGWRGGRHVWVGGHWELPPRAHAEWVEPRWERHGNGYVLVEGFWRDVGVTVSVGGPRPQEVVVIREAPPGPRHEVIGPRPSRNHVWIAGYWAWRGGRQTWVSGRWELPPRGHTAWVEPRWERRGDGYIFIEGSWR